MVPTQFEHSLSSEQSTPRRPDVRWESMGPQAKFATCTTWACGNRCLSSFKECDYVSFSLGHEFLTTMLEIVFLILASRASDARRPFKFNLLLSRFFLNFYMVSLDCFCQNLRWVPLQYELFSPFFNFQFQVRMIFYGPYRAK